MNTITVTLCVPPVPATLSALASAARQLAIWIEIPRKVWFEPDALSIYLRPGLRIRTGTHRYLVLVTTARAVTLSPVARFDEGNEHFVPVLCPLPQQWGRDAVLARLRAGDWRAVRL